MYRDCRNLAVTASCSKTVELLDAATDSYLGMRKDVTDRAAQLAAADPDAPLAHCLIGFLNLHAGKREMLPNAREALALAMACSFIATARENHHIGALSAWLEGDFVRALDHWEQILANEPRDVLALRLAQFITSYLGRSRSLCDSVSRVMVAWEPAVPGYGFVLGCYAYGLEEAGIYDNAERFGRTAVNLNPEDLWATHAVAHVMEMQCRAREGMAWLQDAQPHLAECGNFVRHLWWHRCLYLMTLAEYDGVLHVYDQQVRAESTDEYLDIVNSASLLWRLEQFGVEVGGRWQELAAHAASRTHDHLYILADLHYIAALAAGAPRVAIRQFLDSCAEFSSDAVRTEAQVMRGVGLAVAQAIVEHRNGCFAEAMDLANRAKDGFHTIGGSHAQRDIFDQLLIDAAIRADRLAVARTLLRERLTKRPRDLWSWKHLEQVSSALDDPEGLADAKEKVHELLVANQVRASRGF